MSAAVYIVCNGCGTESERAGRVQDLRDRLYKEGWTGGYVHKPYSGKRADYCPKCSQRMAYLEHEK